MAWTGQNFSVGQLLTAAQMNNLQNDITALANGDSGAPEIQSAALAASSVDRGALKSAISNQSTSVGAGTQGTITPTGGDYTMVWFPGGSRDGYGYSSDQHVGWFGGDSSPNVIGVVNSNASTATFYLRSNYIQASPPYNLGYGEIPKFILAQIDKSTGDVIGTYSAEDPPWAYHGPHDCHPINSILLRSVGLWGVNISEAMNTNPDATLEKLKAMRDLRQDKKRLQQARKDYALSIEDKNIDMDSVPHLFSNFDQSKHVAVMLDPCSSLAEKLALEDEFTGPEFSVSNLLHDGYINIDNNALAVRSPSGVITVPFSMKLTRG